MLGQCHTKSTGRKQQSVIAKKYTAYTNIDSFIRSQGASENPTKGTHWMMFHAELHTVENMQKNKVSQSWRRTASIPLQKATKGHCAVRTESKSKKKYLLLDFHFFIKQKAFPCCTSQEKGGGWIYPSYENTFLSLLIFLPCGCSEATSNLCDA